MDGPIGLAARLRAQFNDRLRPHAFDGESVVSKELLPDGLALNRTTKIVIRPESNGHIAAI